MSRHLITLWNESDRQRAHKYIEQAPAMTRVGLAGALLGKIAAGVIVDKEMQLAHAFRDHHESEPLVPEGTPEGLRATLAAAGFADVEVTEIEVTRTFSSFDDYWDTQAMPFSPSGKTIAKLSDEQRGKLREAMREMLPAAADGSITYASTAMAGRGRKP